MTPTQYIHLLADSFVVSKTQSYFPRYFGGNLNEQGEITELMQKLFICGVANILGGNIVEIGAAEGKASGALAEIAHKHGKKLLVIDPYNGAQEGTESLYHQFLAVQNRYRDTIIHRRDSSLTPESIAAIKDFAPSFVFVDGLHIEDVAYSDIRAAHDALPVGGVVCVDDTNFLRRDAGAALTRAIGEGLFELVAIPTHVEQVMYSYKSWHFAVKR